ncbi:MAG: diguanylate cyclase [Rhodocyclaceae bacterium]
MMPIPPPRSRFLRVALVAGGLFVAIALLLDLGARRSAEESLMTLAEQRVRDVEVALEAALPPVFADGGAALEVLRDRLGLSYLVLQDSRRQTLAGAGHDIGAALPAITPDVRSAVEEGVHFDGAVSVRRGDTVLGHARYGLSLAFVRDSPSAVAHSAFAIAAVCALAGFWLAALGARTLLRRFRDLTGALRTLAETGRAVRLPAQGTGEMAGLLRTANESARLIEQRVATLGAQAACFRSIAECAYGVDAWFNPRGRLVWINPSIERITGFTPLECALAGDLVETLIYLKDRKYAHQEAKRAMSSSGTGSLELRLQRKDGSLVWVAIGWQPINSAEGRYLGLRVSMDEIQARKDAELKLLETVAELRRAQGLKEYYLNRSNEERARLGALLDVMKVGVLFVNRDRRVLFCNKALYHIWRVPDETDLTGVREESLMAQQAPMLADEAAYRKHIAEVLKRSETSAPFEFALMDGRTLMEISTLVPGPVPGRYIGRVWIHEDITQQKQTADRLIQLAERDALTNLYNRRRFHEELDRMLAEAARRDTELGLLVIDLDGFKPINDTYGHQAGDAVLVALAQEVGSAVRRNEMFFRVGGDEFCILAPDSSEEEIVGLARRILAKITGLRFCFAGDEVRLTASVGIALYPAHGRTGQELMDRGDQAMYGAKTSGKNRWQIWQAQVVG